MKRPQLINFLCVFTDEWISIRAAVTMRENPLARRSSARSVAAEAVEPRFPIQAYKLLRSYEFKMKLVGLDAKQNIIFSKIFDSDSLGDFRVERYL